MRDYLQSFWYDENRVPPFPLRAAAKLYGALLRVRRWLYRTGWLKVKRLPVPVIVVGNITVGGTGKTPLTMALIHALRAQGYRPGVVSRGYGGNAKVPQLVDAASQPDQVGDEPCLIWKSTQAPVAVGRDRLMAARLLLSAADVDIVIADDGLQHARLDRDVEICVVDGERRFGNGYLLPAGPLRELPGARTFAFTVCNGAKASSGEYRMHFQLTHVVALTDGGIRLPLSNFVGKRVHAVAGIGNPSRFFSQLRSAGLDVIEHPFMDHYVFLPADFRFGDSYPVLMTEKDAVKCVSFAGRDWYAVAVQAQPDEAFFSMLIEQLRRGKNGLV